MAAGPFFFARSSLVLGASFRRCRLTVASVPRASGRAEGFPRRRRSSACPTQSRPICHSGRVREWHRRARAPAGTGLTIRYLPSTPGKPAASDGCSAANSGGGWVKRPSEAERKHGGKDGPRLNYHRKIITAKCRLHIPDRRVTCHRQCPQRLKFRKCLKSGLRNACRWARTKKEQTNCGQGVTKSAGAGAGKERADGLWI